MAFEEEQQRFMSRLDAQEDILREGVKHEQLIQVLTRIAEAQERANQLVAGFIVDPIHDQLMEYIEKNRKVTMIIGAMQARVGFPRLIDHGVVHLQDDNGIMSYVRIKEIQAVSEDTCGTKED